MVDPLTVSDASDAFAELEPIGLWTPAARMFTRLQRVSGEDPGSMQQFHTALLTTEVIIKLHTVALLTILEGYEQTPYARHAYDLSRSNGLGAWNAALRECVTSVQPLLSAGVDRRIEWVIVLRNWLSGRLPAEEYDSAVAPTHTLADALAGESRQKPSRTVLGLLDALVEIRNKTTAHRAYDRDFWEKNLATVVSASIWLARTSPLWRAELILPVRSMTGFSGRLLRGSDPSATLGLPESHAALAAHQKERA